MKSITLKRRSVAASPTNPQSYVVELEVSTANNIDKNLFVKQRFRKPEGIYEDKFAAVCSPAQLQDLDTVSPASGESYFRDSKVTLIGTNPSYLDSVVNEIVSDIQILIDNDTSLEFLVDSEEYFVSSDSSYAVEVVKNTPANGRYSKSIFIETPVANDSITFFFSDTTITPKKIVSSTLGDAGSEVQWVVKYGSNRNLAGTSLVTGQILTDVNQTTISEDFTTSTIPENSFVWVEVNTIIGTIRSIDITFIFD